jgi:AraC family transcriptional regulator, transcriptional activator of the genes for pyochelin and ferripyochelin receptors
MPFELTHEVFDTLWYGAKLRGEADCPDTEFEIIDRARLDHVGQFFNWQMSLPGGLSLRINQVEVAEDLLQGTTGEPSTDTGACMVFCLSGRVQTTHRSSTRTVERLEKTGYCFLENLSGVKETELWTTGETFFRVYIDLADPQQWLQDFAPHQIGQLPVELQRTLDGQTQPYYRTTAMTAEMYRVLRQILHCPYVGELKKLYLYGKALELMALQFSQFQTQQQSHDQLQRTEVERIHYAREILTRQLDDPPSLLELARMAGLNDFALKQGFKRVFGSTVFGYLREHRLTVASQLLAASELRIQDIAELVGFRNRGYFAAVFRQKFNLSPHQYRLQHRYSP